MTFIAFESFAVTTVLPVAVSDLGDTRWYSFAYAATITTGLIGMVVGGNWADLAGPRTPLIVGGSFFLFGLVLNVFAFDISSFIFGRLLQGIGGGIDSVVLYVLIARIIPETSRPRMFGLLTTAWLVPSLAGPVVAGVLVEITGWRAVFGIVFLGSAGALFSLLWTSSTPPDEANRHLRSKPFRVGVFGRNGTRATLAALLLVVLHLSAQLDVPTSAVVVVVISIMLFVVARTILPPGTLTLRGTPQRLIVIRALLGATVTTADLYLTLYLQTDRGYAPTTAGLIIAVGAAGWALGAWFQSHFSSTLKVHARLIVVAATFVTSGPVVMLAYTFSLLPLWVVIIAGVLMGVGMGMAYPRLSSATLELAQPNEQGVYSAALQAGESMSVAVVTALISVVFVPAEMFSIVFTALTSLALTALLIAYFTSLKRCLPTL